MVIVLQFCVYGAMKYQCERTHIVMYADFFVTTELKVS
jgi:hypothetical protein